MPLPISHIKERLSVAYVRTVTAKAGAMFLTSDGTEYGTDAIIQKVKLLPNGKYTASGWSFNCQLKATTDWIENKNEIIYDIEADAYNKLVCWEGTPCILILYRLPKDDTNWLLLDENVLQLRSCCYWIHLIGLPSSNKSTVRIQIPRSQLFCPESVNYLLDTVSANEGRIP